MTNDKKKNLSQNIIVRKISTFVQYIYLWSCAGILSN